MIRTTVRRAQRHLRGRGLVGTAIFAARYPYTKLQALRTRSQTQRERAEAIAFDQQYQLDTATTIRAEKLPTAHPHWVHAGHYEPIAAELFSDMMAHVPVMHADYTFVDYGSGKGKALLLASHYPFKQVIGIELVHALHATAERNITRYTHPDQQCRRLVSVHMDATAFRLPDEPLVLLFYNPFGEAVMRAVLAHIESSLSACPRPLYVLYANPVHRGLFDRAPFLSLVARGQHHLVYRAPA